MTETDTSSTTRFSSRVQNYTRYRPSYPSGSVQWIIEHYQLSPQSQVADIGSGTGIFSQLLMDAGLTVTAVEPNRDMRIESDRQHSTNSLYASLDGTAESTQLDTDSVDMVTAAQAGHWFDLETSKKEFQRILRPTGVLAMIWNRRDRKSAFQSAYEATLSKLPEYAKVGHSNLEDAQITEFFAGNMERKAFMNSQKFDLGSFRGRVFSSSYTPSPGDAQYEAFSQEIDALFSEYSIDDKVVFAYTTEIYSGHME